MYVRDKHTIATILNNRRSIHNTSMHSKEPSAPGIVHLEKFGDGWIGTWSDGDQIISRIIHVKDRRLAEHELDRLVALYIDSMRTSHIMSDVAQAIQSASPIELAQIAYKVKAAMALHGMKWNSDF